MIERADQAHAELLLLRRECGMGSSTAELAADVKILRRRTFGELIGRCRRVLAEEVRPTKRLRAKFHPEDL